MHIQSSASFEENLFIWNLEGHRIEFTIFEFDELILAIKTRRLFTFLKNERPALSEQILFIYKDSLIDPDDVEQLQFNLEQRIIEYSHLR